MDLPYWDSNDRGVIMKILKDESAQTSAELLLVMGGMIVIAIVVAILYKNYLSGIGANITGTDVVNINNNITNLKHLFQ